MSFIQNKTKGITMTQIDILVSAGLFEFGLLLVMAVCGCWLMTAQTRKSDGHAVNEKHILIPKKIILGCAITFAVSFGLCSAWLFLPQIFR